MTLLFSCFSQKQVVRMGKFFLRLFLISVKNKWRACSRGIDHPHSCGCSSVVERYPSKLDVARSNRVSRLHKKIK
jgi:hypothetical protein